MTDEPAPSPELFPHLDANDRERLRDAAHRLLAHGSILREEPATRDLYDWCRNRTRLLEEWALLLGLKLVWQHEERLLIALPDTPGLLRRLRLDETLVVLALWYDFHGEVSEQGLGTGEVVFTVRDFNERLASKFNRLQQLSASRLREILRHLDRKNLVRFSGADDFANATIRVLPTLRFAIPFQDLDDWRRQAAAYQDEPNSDDDPDDDPPEPTDTDDPQD